MDQFNFKMNDPYGVLILLARQPFDEDASDLYCSFKADRFIVKRMSLYEKIKKVLGKTITQN